MDRRRDMDHRLGREGCSISKGCEEVEDGEGDEVEATGPERCKNAYIIRAYGVL